MSRCTPVTIPPAALAAQCRALGCAVPETALEPLRIYLELLTQWNTVMNLVGTRRWQDTLRILVADSFYLAEFLDGLPLPDAPCVWDPGAGAGLPGLPLRMVWQRGEYTLIEAREKRALFLSTALARLRLPRTTVFQGRLEAFCARASRPVDVVVSRAFLPWPQVLALVEKSLAPDAHVVFLALEEPPASLPDAWQVAAARRYAAGDDIRWFWALRHGA